MDLTFRDLGPELRRMRLTILTHYYKLQMPPRAAPLPVLSADAVEATLANL